MSQRLRTIGCVLTTLLVLPLAAATAPSTGSVATPMAVAKGKCHKGRVALTFDDGPQPHTTKPLLRVLRRKHVRATFFVQGYRAKAYPGTIRRISKAGHRIGNHTWNHPDLTNLSKRQIHSQLARTNRAIRHAGAPRPTLMRPPYGATDRQVAHVARNMNMHEVLWNVDTRNWSGVSVDAIVHGALAGISRGDNIILLHDGVATSNRTVKAVPRIIRGIRKRGYCVGRLNRRGEVHKPYHRLKEKHWSTTGTAR